MKKHNKKELNLTTLLLIGAGVAIASVAAVSFALALISSFTKDPTALTGAFSLLALVLAGGISGFVTSRVNGEGGTLVGILSAVISTSVMMVAGLIWKGGFLPLGAILNLLVFLAVSVISSLLGKKRAKRMRHRRSY